MSEMTKKILSILPTNIYKEILPEESRPEWGGKITEVITDSLSRIRSALQQYTTVKGINPEHFLKAGAEDILLRVYLSDALNGITASALEMRNLNQLYGSDTKQVGSDILWDMVKKVLLPFHENDDLPVWWIETAVHRLLNGKVIIPK